MRGPSTNPADLLAAADRLEADVGLQHGVYPIAPKSRFAKDLGLVIACVRSVAKCRCGRPKLDLRGACGHWECDTFETCAEAGPRSDDLSIMRGEAETELLAALKPFAALVPIHSDRDDTIRHYAVKVGDVRRARAAIAKASEKQT